MFPRSPVSPPAAEKTIRTRLYRAEVANRPHSAGPFSRKSPLKQSTGQTSTLPASFGYLMSSIQNTQDECHRCLEGRRLDEGMPGMQAVPFLSGSEIRAALKNGATVIQKSGTGYSMFPWTAGCHALQQLRQV